ncbi:ketopantoate reductase family protein [Shewanella dokdonensis]|uniref:2-dehydropantoate 2-reductase n=1 Tax=Shewanella dokdonensis TaxID=712036 RepID=A0ABX8DCV1_9GAMM|nr:2-dehydropantoate 2-reductase [Shewanella dokdonensis]MCL1073703.1 2-dehydropantoate 2-reductase [Shewanella dokdonensis]QVK22570.1 2-dehydropantoate 2-reductase [Shewanella dokdonensis]
MSIAILGAGAIGQLLAQQLANGGCQPEFIVRPDKSLPPQQLFTLETTTGSYSRPFSCLSTEAAAAEFSHLSLVIVTLKAYQVVAALSALLPKLSSHCQLLLLHNGLGPHRQIIPLLAGRGLSLGSTSQGALRLGERQIRHTGSGITQFGHIAGPTMPDELKLLLLRAIPHSEWCDDIMLALWGKLAVNAAINPLTAIDNIPNGALADAHYQQHIQAVIAELVEVAQCEGLTLENEALLQRVNQVIKLTANNYSSMQQDVLYHRPTEIDAINGYLLQLAQQHDIELPVNQALVTQVKRL